MICHHYVSVGMVVIFGIAAVTYHVVSRAADLKVEPIHACVITRDAQLNATTRAQIAQCLGWQTDNNATLCRGFYTPIVINPLSGDEIRLMANNVSLYREGRSELSGNVEVQQAGKIVNAQTAYVYRDAKTNQITEIQLLGRVKYLENDRLMIARKATLNPQDKSGSIEDVLYRFNLHRAGSVLPAWGRASFVKRFANKDYLLQKATYTTCAPEDKAWQLEADSIQLDAAKSIGVARNTTLYVGRWPILYSPYLSFPTSKERKSGFLMPLVGSSNVGGFDLAIPYYWNIAPNYDATLTPHFYSKRGLMFEGQYRYLSPHSFSTLQGRFIGHDRAYRHFLDDPRERFPFLNNSLPLMTNKSSDRWSVDLINSTAITSNAHLGINYQQVSDDYFLQDFSTNLAITTERQLLRQADLSYTTNHWLFKGMVQSYQTLNPINETRVAEIYQRLPQLFARGAYDDLPFNSNFSVLSQFDNFVWPDRTFSAVEGARYHLNPELSLPQIKPWGFITPNIDFVENYYDLRNQLSPHVSPWEFYNRPHDLTDKYYNSRFEYGLPIQFFHAKTNYNRTIPRFSLDSGLYFERSTRFKDKNFTQTLEPRLFYLRVPYHNQTPIPVFDSAYMIFNVDQLFRKNRFSGFDRIGDANQLSYALSSRWLSDEFGGEKASFTLGQIRYFADRRVKLCQNISGFCDDEQFTLGLLSNQAKNSPFVGRAIYHFNPNWIMAGDYAWDPVTSGTNNGHLNFHYESETNKILNAGYTYLVNGDVTRVAFTNIQNPLHQLTFAYAWPFNAKWSSLGGYNYNISKRYEMMSFLGMQYDNCCWALRLIGGRTFRSLDSQARPAYNNNFYIQILLKGLGSVGNSDPASRIRTFIPGYVDGFHS